MAYDPSRPELPILIDHGRIAARVSELGAEISRDFAGERVLLVGVLKGAVFFLADLARSITIDASFDFIGVSSYGGKLETKGEVRLTKFVDGAIGGQNVILVEDILDTGLTLRFLRNLLEQHAPKTLRLAACLDKPDRRLEKIEADYVGFRIPDHFVVGYGMDWDERFRNIPDICVLHPEYLRDEKWYRPNEGKGNLRSALR